MNGHVENIMPLHASLAVRMHEKLPVIVVGKKTEISEMTDLQS